MAQIIKHRRGLIGGVKNLTARNGELIIASGSISDLSGPFVFIGSPNTVDEGVAGAFNSVSKLYTGTAAPTITATTYGSALDGTPYYASGNKSLYILNNSNVGNTQIDLTGNIEGNTISGVTINKLQSTTVSASFFTGSFVGDGTGLYNVPASGVTGLELNRISDGTATASISQADGLRINTNTEVTGTLNVNGNTSITGTFVATDGSAFINQGVISQNSNLLLTSGSNLVIQDSGNINVAGNVYITGSEYVDNIYGKTNTNHYLAFNGGAAGAPGVELQSEGNISLWAEGGTVNVTGSMRVTGDIVFSGSINLGDFTGDTVNFTGEVSSSILPSTGSSFDLGSSGKTWNNVWAENAHFTNIDIGAITLNSLALPGDLTVSGTTTLSGSVYVEDLIQGRVTFAGAGGQLVDNENFTYDLANGFLLNTSGSVNINTSGSFNLYTHDGDNIFVSSSSNLNLRAASDINLTAADDIRIDANDTFVLRNAGIGDSITLITEYNSGNEKQMTFDSNGDLTIPGGFTGSFADINTQAQLASAAVEDLTDNRIVLAGVGGELEDDTNFTFDGTTFKVGDGDFEVDVLSGDTRLSGSLLVKNNLNVVNGVGITGSLGVSGSAQFISTINVDGEATLASATVEDLTDNRIVLAGTGGSLEDDANFTFDGSELKIGLGNFEISTDGDTRTSGSLTAVGDVFTDNVISLDSTNALHLNGGNIGAPDVELTSNGAISLYAEGGDITMTGSVRITSDLAVTGSATINGTTTVNNDVNITGILTVTGETRLQSNLYVSGNLEVLGSSTNVNIQSQTVDIGDNIIQVNAYSPFDRYAGLSAYDSGSSGTSGSVLWDSTNDYWLIVNSNTNSSKIIGTTASTGGTGTEISLTSGTFPIATASNTIGDSLLTYSGTTLAYNTNKFTVDSGTGATAISGNLTLSYSGGTDNGTKTSAVTFRNSSNVLGFVSTTETTNELDGILGYNHSSGVLEFSSLIDGGTY